MTEQKTSLNPLALVLLLSGAFFAIFLVISGIFFLYTGSHPSVRTSVPGALLSGGVVGIVEINGVIMDSKKTLAKLDRLEEDDRVKAVVLRLNSPGGSVAPSQEIYEAVRHYKKPILASMSSVAASGAYYIACAAKKIYANPGTLTGSIGVVFPLANLQKLYEWAKIQRYVLKAGKFKDVGADYREMTPDERALMQTMIDDVMAEFKQAVATGRKLPMEKVDQIADGRIMSGHQAKLVHLVDELGTLQDAVNEAGVMGKIKGKPNVIYLDKKRNSVLDFIMDMDDRSDDASSESTFGAKVGQAIAGSLVGSMLGTAPLPHSSARALEPGLYWLWQ